MPKKKPAKAKRATKAKKKVAKKVKRVVRAAKPIKKKKTVKAAKPKTIKKVKAATKTAGGLRVGQAVPNMNFETTSGARSFAHYLGKNLVLYFYPKDDTPGCTLEGQNFRNRYADYQATNTAIVGVSRDDLKSHASFCSKFQFPFELASDPNESLCRAFDVMREKNLYGKSYVGVDRSTFLIDKTGVLRREWRSVKVDGHVDEVLSVVKAL